MPLTRSILRNRRRTDPLMLKIPAGAPASRSVALLGRSMGIHLTAPVRFSIVLRTRQGERPGDETLRRLSAIWPHPAEIEILPAPAPQGKILGGGRQSWRLPFLRSANPARRAAHNAALAQARGQFVLLLDEDILPAQTALRSMLEHFRADPRLGAAVLTVTDTDGAQWRAELPDLILSGATAFRRRALDLAGFFPQDLLTPAAECDLSLRLIEQGWHVRRFEDLRAVRIPHEGNACGPAGEIDPGDLFQLETSEDLLLIARRFPWRWMIPYAMDWMCRRQWMARRDRQYARFRSGLLEGLLLSACTPRRTVSGRTFESLTRILEIERSLRQAAHRLNLHRIVLIDCGRNLYAYYRAARRCGLRIAAIADNDLAATKRHYRNIPVLDEAAARRLKYDAAIPTAPSLFTPARRHEWTRENNHPVLDLLAQPDFRLPPSHQESVRAIAGRITPAAAARAEAAARRTAARSA